MFTLRQPPQQRAFNQSHFPSEQLITSITLPASSSEEKDKIEKVWAHYKLESSLTWSNEYLYDFTITVSIDKNGKKPLGFLLAKIDGKGTPNRFMVPLKASEILEKHIYVDHMENQSKYKYIGTALLEAAFRLSTHDLIDAEGRIRMEAVRVTHYFHYVNGFRYSTEKNKNSRSKEEYYQALAKELDAANGERITNELDSIYLDLSPLAILKKNIKFGLINPDEAQKKLALQEEDELSQYRVKKLSTASNANTKDSNNNTVSQENNAIITSDIKVSAKALRESQLSVIGNTDKRQSTLSASYEINNNSGMTMNK